MVVVVEEEEEDVGDQRKERGEGEVFCREQQKD